MPNFPPVALGGISLRECGTDQGLTSQAQEAVLNRVQKCYASLEKAMKKLQAFLLATIMMFPIIGMSDNGDRQAEQEKLDAECEAARELKLAPERAKFSEECVEKQQKSDRAACERFYSDYGARFGNRAPLYYDLPECVRAFEFQRSHRRR